MNTKSLIILALVCVTCMAFTSCKNEAPVKKEIIRPVRTMIVGDVQDLTNRTFPGITRELQSVDLAFRVGGPLIQLNATEGQQVIKGQLIAEIDPRDFRIDLLAKEGVRFTNFFANAPVCSPARFTILHGVHASSAGTMNMRSRYNVPDTWKTYPEYLKEAGYYCTNNSKTDYNFSGNWDVWDESSKKAHYKNRAPGQPFFAVFNFTSTHESRIHKYDASELIHNPDKMILPDYVPDTEEMRNDMAKLYDNISKMDEQAGKILTELDEAGLRDSTIVFFYSDHGGVYPRAKRYIHRTGTWVPLIIRVPRGLEMSNVKHGGVSDRLVSFVDLAPTVLSLAGY